MKILRPSISLLAFLSWSCGGEPAAPGAAAREAAAEAPRARLAATLSASPEGAARAESAAPDPTVAEVAGTVTDFDSSAPLHGVAMLCLEGTPADGKRTQETPQNGTFRWTLQDSSRVEIRFSYTGWSVITPAPVQTPNGQSLPDVAGWDLPAEPPQNVEMFRTDVQMELGESVTAYASALGRQLVARARRDEGGRWLDEAWSRITRSPLPVFVRALTAREIVTAELPAALVPATCAAYASVEPAEALRWDRAVRAADKGVGELPSLRAAEVTGLPETVVIDALEAAVRARMEGREEGKLDRASLLKWSRGETLRSTEFIERLTELPRFKPQFPR